MVSLVAVSVFWAFSFGLIKLHLAGLDGAFLAWARMALAWPVFLPFWRPRKVDRRLTGRLLLVGAVQYGLMYVTYLSAFRFLSGYQVALSTILTPVYVTLLEDAYARRLRPVYLLCALLSVAGAGVVRYAGLAWDHALAGFALMQVSNACFAWGQVEYKRLRPRFAAVPDHQVYAAVYLGALLVTTVMTTLMGSWDSLARVTLLQAEVLLYLGVVASGLCFFWWNRGALQVNAGTLAVFNNVKIPLGVLVSLVVFQEPADMLRLAAGGALMVAGVAWAEWAGRRGGQRGG